MTFQYHTDTHRCIPASVVEAFQSGEYPGMDDAQVEELQSTYGIKPRLTAQGITRWDIINKATGLRVYASKYVPVWRDGKTFTAAPSDTVQLGDKRVHILDKPKYVCTCPHCETEQMKDDMVPYFNHVLEEDGKVCPSCVSSLEMVEYAGGMTDCPTLPPSHAREYFNYTANPFDKIPGGDFVLGDGEKKRPKLPYMGVELEVSLASGVEREHAIQEINRVFSYQSIAKSDSSVINGFELCTLPMTLRGWKDNLKDTFDRVFLHNVTRQDLMGIGDVSCGMHIHVSRDAWTPAMVGKLRVFMSNPLNALFINSYAGRANNSYCASLTPAKSWKEVKKGEDLGSGGGRAALARGKGGKTIEFRLFGSVTKQWLFLSNVEFVHGLWSFCRVGNGCTNLHFTDFVRYMVENRGAYPNFFKKCIRLGVIDMKGRIEKEFLEERQMFVPIFKRDSDMKETLKKTTGYACRGR